MTNKYLELNATDQELFSTAFSFAPIGMAMLDQNGNFIKVHSSFCNFLGYTEEELLNLNFKVITHPEVLTVDLKQNQKLNTGEISNFLMEMRFLHKYGYTKWGLQTVNILLQSFLKHNLDPILIFDQDETLIQANDAFAKTFGWSEASLIGKKRIDIPFIPQNKKHEVNEITKKNLNGNRILEYETVRVKKDGTHLNVLMTTFPIKDDKNFNYGQAVIFRDITEKKKAEELMIQSEKLSVAGQLSAAIAHEIRNPITTIKGFIKLLQTAEEKQLYYDIMDSEIGRIEQILNELLSLAKPQKGLVKICHLNDVLEQVISLLNAEANLNGIEIIKNFNTYDDQILCDPNQIKQVIINFIKNSFDALPEGGSLKIEVNSIQDKQVLQILFTDTGYGIPNEILAKIGQPFFTTKENGTGLGFMVSKKIIESLNGQIYISSEAQKGTTIEVHLPVLTN